MKHFDIAVLGAGSGLIIMEGAVKAGKSVAVIESGAFGGTCLNRGCIPSKMLVYPADLIQEARRGERVGISFPEPAIDWDKISRRMRRQIDVNESLEQDVSATPGVTVYRGTGAFYDPHTLDIALNDGGTARITADHIVIATGSRTRVPDMEGIDAAQPLTSESFFADRFPQRPYDSLLIIGGGFTALEFAHIFSAFGTKVTLAVRSETILRGMDADIPPFVQRQLEDAGVRFLYEAVPQKIERKDGQQTVTFRDRITGRSYDVTAQEVLLASGILPNSHQLNLDAAGLITDKSGYIPTDSKLRTNVPHIHAIGDVNGLYPLRHKANYEAEVLNNVLFGDDTREALYTSVPEAVFTNPQVGSVGLSEAAARERFGDDIIVRRYHYSDIIAGIAMGYSARRDDDGFAKVITDDKKRLLGVHVVGPQAGVIVQPYAYLMNAGGPAQAATPGTWLPIEHSMTIHPTFAELTAWALIYPQG